MFEGVDLGHAPAKAPPPPPRNHNHPPELLTPELPLDAPNFGPGLKGLFREVCWRRGLDPKVVAQDCRKKAFTRARWEFCWRARQVRREDGSFRYSLPFIGLSLVRFGRPTRMDHTSVLHAVRRHGQLIDLGEA